MAASSQLSVERCDGAVQEIWRGHCLIVEGSLFQCWPDLCRQPDMIGPTLRADLGRMAAAVIAAVDQHIADAGLVDLNYGTARFVVQYDDIEQVVIRKN